MLRREDCIYYWREYVEYSERDSGPKSWGSNWLECHTIADKGRSSFRESMVECTQNGLLIFAERKKPNR